MPAPASLDASAITSLVHSATAGGSDPGALDRAFASGSTVTGLDTNGIQGLLKGATSGSSGPSILDPTYLAISGTLGLIGTGMFIWGKKMGQLRYVCWGLALLVLSYDYTSGPVWLVTVLLGVAGTFLE